LGVFAPPQVWPAPLQVSGPHRTVPAQPSEMTPQSSPPGQAVMGVQGAGPHLLAPPPPQVSPTLGQVPHVRTPPQPSGWVPQLPAPQVFGVQQPDAVHGLVAAQAAPAARQMQPPVGEQ
jgi:hypothetical protein